MNLFSFIRQIKIFLLKNPLQKILALVFAILIWAFAPSMEKPSLSQMQIFVPVSYINTPQDLEIVSQPQQSVGITIEITNDEIPNPSLFQTFINLENAYPGEQIYEIAIEDIKHPERVKILKISPDKLAISFEKTLERELTIKPAITAINIPKQLSIVSPEPEYYKARIEIGSEPMNVRFDDIPIGIVNQEYVTRINPRAFSVLLRGPRSIMQTFSKQDVQAFIDLRDYKPGKYKIEASELTLRLRPEIQMQKIWPPIHIWVKNQRIEE